MAKAMEAPFSAGLSGGGGMFRPSRSLYPGSRSGPKTRYDLPQRHKTYGNANELDTVLFSGSLLQPEATAWGTATGPPSSPGDLARSTPLGGGRGAAPGEGSSLARTPERDFTFTLSFGLRAYGSSFRATLTKAASQRCVVAVSGDNCSAHPPLDHFKVLNLSPVASLSEITEAYHQQALRWLPEYDLEEPEVAEKTFEEVLGAYQMIARQLKDRPVLPELGELRQRAAPAERNLPELPLINDRNDVHGIAVLGGKSSGKTTLICSLLAALEGKYPHSHAFRDKLREMPVHGNSWEFPERDVLYVSGETKQMRVVLTDTPPAGVKSREEQPLCATVSPNSALHYSAVPSWMRIILRSGNLPHYAVLFVIDSTAPPLWEDFQRSRELARLLAVLKRSQYTVIIAVTKLLQLREDRLREAAYGSEHNGEVGKDPRSSYESFVSRYIDKVCACIQARAAENDWTFADADAPAFPLPNSSIFDVPTWTSVTDHQAWQGRRGTPELPNFRYINSQLTRTGFRGV
eukprot:s555_g5.t1